MKNIYSMLKNLVESLSREVMVILTEKERTCLKWNVQPGHMDEIVLCPQTFGHNCIYLYPFLH